MGSVEIDYTVTYPELQQYSDYELSSLMMYSDRDRKDNYWAECVYWMCILEISNRREIVTEYTDVICIGAVTNKAGEKIFVRGKTYTLYAIDNVALVFDEELHPFIFRMIKDDMYCVTNFFRLADES